MGLDAILSNLQVLRENPTSDLGHNFEVDYCFLGFYSASTVKKSAHNVLKRSQPTPVLFIITQRPMNVVDVRR